MLTVGVPTLKRYDLLGDLIRSCEAGTRKPDRYYIVDNGGTLDIDTSLPIERIEIVKPGRNLGISASFNHIIKTCGDMTLISGDDVTMNENTLEGMEKAFWEQDAHFFSPEGGAGLTFCVFAQKLELFNLIGEYDEEFWPAWFEDNDYHRRMKLGNAKEYTVPGVAYLHKVSSTLEKCSEKEKNEFSNRFQENKGRYLQKWGGMPGYEKFNSPFGG